MYALEEINFICNKLFLNENLFKAKFLEDHNKPANVKEFIVKYAIINRRAIFEEKGLLKFKLWINRIVGAQQEKLKHCDRDTIIFFIVFYLRFKIAKYY